MEDLNEIKFMVLALERRGNILLIHFLKNIFSYTLPFVPVCFLLCRSRPVPGKPFLGDARFFSACTPLSSPKFPSKLEESEAQSRLDHIVLEAQDRII